MSEVQAQLSPVTRKVANILEERFPELSKKYCPERSGGFCELTGSRCTLAKCQKMKKTISAHV